MANFLKKNKIFIIIMAVCVAAAVFVMFERAQIESENKTYDIVIDYNELEKLAEQSEHDLSWWLSKFKEMGITKVGLSEESIITLMEDTSLSVNGEMMDIVTREATWRNDYPAEFVQAIDERGFDSFDVIVEAKGKEAVDFVTEGITSRIDSEKSIVMETEDAGYYFIDGTSDVTLYSQSYKYVNSKKGGFAERADIVSSKIMYISLGLLPEKVELVQDAGMEIIPRTMSYGGWNDTEYAEAVIAGYEKYDIVPEYIIVGGEAVFGFDEGSEFAKNYILDNDITIGLIENTTQLQNIIQNGVQEVAITSEYDTVRVFSVWNYIQYRYQYYGYEGAEEIENTLFRAVTERNIRVIYFKPFLQNEDLHTYVTNPDEYVEMFDNLEQRLARHGYSFGEASTMTEYNVSRIVQILVGIGVAIGAIMLLCSILPIGKKAAYALSGIAVIGVLGANYVMPNTSILITSFGAAVVFACLGITFFTAQSRYLQERNSSMSLIKIIGCAALTLVITVLIALVGAVMTAAPISSTSFMLEIDIFRGVKLSQLLPIAYFALAFLAYFGFGNSKKHIGRLEILDIKDLLFVQIRIWMIIAVAAVGVLGYYYIARTGHDTSIEVSSIEMLFRNTLEEVLLARPRSKEFLFAFPAIMMMVYCSIKKFKMWSLVFGMGGVIGVTSVINTFMHIRTPLYLGFARTGYSLLFGMILGIVAILIFNGIYAVYAKYFKTHVDKALTRE